MLVSAPRDSFCTALTRVSVHSYVVPKLRGRLPSLSDMQIPLIFSGIFYACNTEYHIKYVDCLFLCVSSMCVTGLATNNLSTLSTFQQFMMYFQMLIGSLVSLSLDEPH